MDANGLIDTGLTPERLAALDPKLSKTLLTAWELVRTERSSYPAAMEFLDAYLRQTTPNPIPLWRMRQSMDFVFGLAKRFDVRESWTEIDFPVLLPHDTWIGP